MIQIVVWIVLIIKLLHLKNYGLLYVGLLTEVYIIYVIVLRNIMSGLSLAKLLRWHFVQLGCALFSFWALTWENAIPLSTWWKHYLEEWPFGPHCCCCKKKEVKENILGRRENGHSTVRICTKVNSRMFLAGSVGVSANHISIDLVYG